MKRELDESVWAWAAKRRAYLDVLDRVGEIASRASIPLILLKGPCLAERLYEPAEARPFRDLDIMVRESSFESLISGLLDAGFTLTPGPFRGLSSEVLRRWELPQTLSPRDAPGLHLDLHMNIMNRLEPYRFDPDSLWKRAEPWESGLLRLADEDLLFFLFVHSLKHGFCSLLPFFDLHLAAGDTLLAGCFQTVVRRSERYGFGSLVGVAVELGRRLFGTQWPGEVPISRRVRLAANLLQRCVRTGSPWISERFQLLLSASLLVDSADRLARYWRLSLFRPTAVVPAQRYQSGPWSNPWAGAVRLARSMQRRGR